MAPFETSMWQVRQHPADSAVGRAATAGQPEWLTGLQAAADAHLVSVAREGMQLVVMLPVRHGTDTIAVLELCTRAAAEPDEELDTALQVIAAALGHVHQLLAAAGTPNWTSAKRRL